MKIIYFIVFTLLSICKNNANPIELKEVAIAPVTDDEIATAVQSMLSIITRISQIEDKSSKIEQAPGFNDFFQKFFQSGVPVIGDDEFIVIQRASPRKVQKVQLTEDSDEHYYGYNNNYNYKEPKIIDKIPIIVNKYDYQSTEENESVSRNKETYDAAQDGETTCIDSHEIDDSNEKFELGMENSKETTTCLTSSSSYESSESEKISRRHKIINELYSSETEEVGSIEVVEVGVEKLEENPEIQKPHSSENFSYENDTDKDSKLKFESKSKSSHDVKIEKVVADEATEDGFMGGVVSKLSGIVKKIFN